MLFASLQWYLNILDPSIEDWFENNRVSILNKYASE